MAARGKREASWAKVYPEEVFADQLGINVQPTIFDEVRRRDRTAFKFFDGVSGPTQVRLYPSELLRRSSWFFWLRFERTLNLLPPNGAHSIELLCIPSKGLLQMVAELKIPQTL